MIKKYFTGSLLFTALSLIAAFFIGQMYGGTGMAFTYIISCLMLGVLEVSVSLDNAVVNASILKEFFKVILYDSCRLIFGSDVFSS